jgi:uncharacterized membrane protein YoaK (UPF0700 family)
MEDRTPYAAMLLAWVAGSVDGLGYLVLFHLFTANMTGNSVTLGTALGQGQWGAALRSAFPLPLFLLGVAVGAIAREAARHRGVAPRPVVLGIETVPLLAFLLAGAVLDGADRILPDSWPFHALAGLATFAMGLQNAVPPRVHGRSVRTTYVTGTLTDFAESVVACLLPAPGLSRRAALLGVVLYGGIWSAYVAGAVTSGLTAHRWGAAASALALAGLVAVILHDLTRPPR